MIILTTTIIITTTTTRYLAGPSPNRWGVYASGQTVSDLFKARYYNNNNYNNYNKNKKTIIIMTDTIFILTKARPSPTK